jgi:hypothetical protein
MMHLCQAYAPLDTAHRTLNVFGCNTVKCSADSGSWLVLRSQKPFESGYAATAGVDASAGEGELPGAGSVLGFGIDHEAQTGSPSRADPYPSLGHAAAAAAPPVADWGIEGANDWGVNGDDWGDDGTGDAEAADEAGLLEILSLVDRRADRSVEAGNVANATGAEAKAPRRSHAQPGAKGESTHDSATSSAAVDEGIMLDIVPEPDASVDDGKPSAEDARRLELYEEAMRSAEVIAAEGSGEVWEDEEYEADTQNKAFRKFQKRLSRLPEQVLRYSWGGRPLWPTASLLHEPPLCAYCGQRCIFEMQLLPSVLYVLEVDPLEGMDFASLMVFACPQGCSSDEAVTPDSRYLTEHVVFVP